ncbi:uncharacterized protein LOC134785358 [Penaeus indicus]|uniref:uncharacterized protein LOC134785358 n=1 Tax=Penaeus indicus TaxID=29960 RepID=UPI00300CF6A6
MLHLNIRERKIVNSAFHRCNVIPVKTDNPAPLLIRINHTTRFLSCGRTGFDGEARVISLILCCSRFFYLYLMILMDSSTNASVDCGVRRKHRSISLQDKVDLLRKLDCGVPVRVVCKTYGIGSSTLYDIKKKREEILQFIKYCDSERQINARKTMKAGKSTELDRVLVDWYRKCRSEGVKLTCNTIMEQAKIFHKDLKLEGERRYGEGWLQRFKKRHGISTSRVCGDEKASTLTTGAAEDLVPGDFDADETEANVEDEILNMVLKDMGKGKRDDSDCEDITEIISVERLIKLTDELIDGLDHCDFMPKQEVIIFHLLRDRLHRERTKRLKQLGLNETSKKQPHPTKDSENRMSRKRKADEDESSIARPSKQQCVEERMKSLQKTTQATSPSAPVRHFPHDDHKAVTVASPRPSYDKMPNRNSHHIQHSDHHTLILKRLLEDATFADVTLTAEGESLKAHKAVLSAMSPYFNKVLQKNPSPHPIIIMPLDMSFEDLRGIMNYIYMGEIIVPTENSSSLLKAAEVLQIPGLITLDVKEEPLSFSDAQSALPDSGDSAVSTNSNRSSGINLDTSGSDVNKLQSSYETRMNTVSSSSDIEILPQAKWQKHTHNESVYSMPAVEAADPLDTDNQEIPEDAALSGEANDKCSLMADVLVLLPDQEGLSRNTDYEYGAKKEAWDDCEVRYLESDCTFNHARMISEEQWSKRDQFSVIPPRAPYSSNALLFNNVSQKQVGKVSFHSHSSFTVTSESQAHSSLNTYTGTVSVSPTVCVLSPGHTSNL